MKLTIVRGIPGSGKSTYAKKNYNCLILEQDMFFQRDDKYSWSLSQMKNAVAWCKAMCKSNLRYMDVCVVNTFTRKSFIQDYEQIARECGAKFEVVRMEHEYGNVHNVPVDVLSRMKSGFEDWPGEVFAS